MKIGLNVLGLEDTQKMMRAIATDQAAYAVSLAVNQTAKDFQEAERKEIGKEFTLRRRAWAERSVKITHFSKKKDNGIYATVAIETPGDASRSDILSKFEDGGQKTARDGGEVAVPDLARRTKSDIVSKSARPRSFGFQLMGTGPKATIYRGNRRTFMIVKPDGSGGIYQRVGAKQKRNHNGTIAGRKRRGRETVLRRLFKFERSVTIDSRLNFEKTAEHIGNTRFVKNAEAALDKALATAR